MNFISWDTFFGMILGFGLFIFAIVTSTDNTAVFISISSLGMVVGGTLAATFISYKGIYVFRALKDLLGIIVPVSVGKKELFADIELLIGWSQEVKEKGIAVLDDKLESVDQKKEQFFYYGLELLTSGYKGDELRNLLSRFMFSSHERSNVQVGILKTMSAYSPAFGMIGTVVGLVIMLDGLKDDPTKLGAGLALALITTLYGVIMANLIFKPAALKTQQKNNMIKFRNTILLEGMVLISQKIEPLKLQDELNSYLDPSIHFNLLDNSSKN